MDGSTEAIADTLLGRLETAAEARFVPAVVAFVHDLARAAGLPAAQASRLAPAVEEVCGVLARDGFDPGERGRYELAVLLRPGRLVVAVEHHGRPFLPEAPGRPAHLALADHVDEVRRISAGREGQRLELAWTLPAGRFQAEAPPDLCGEPPRADDEPALRAMTPDDAWGLARLVYRCYGYSYGSEQLYYPAQVATALREGTQLAELAVDAAGEIVGHVALTAEHAGAPVADSGKAVVDPRYRGRHLFERLKERLCERGRGQGMVAIYSEAVTLHPFSQKGNLALGGIETGLLVGAISADVTFRGLSHGAPARHSAMLMVVPLATPPERAVHLPARHRPMIRRIVDRLGLPRPDAGAPAASPPATTELAVRRSQGQGDAFLEIRRCGADLPEVAVARVGELRLDHMACIFADLPLGDPGTPAACDCLEAMGFFFAGLIPELRDGDVLRLQLLNNVRVDPAAIQVASPWGEELRDYVLGAMVARPAPR